MAAIDVRQPIWVQDGEKQGVFLAILIITITIHRMLQALLQPGTPVTPMLCMHSYPFAANLDSKRHGAMQHSQRKSKLQTACKKELLKCCYAT